MRRNWMDELDGRMDDFQTRHQNQRSKVPPSPVCKKVDSSIHNLCSNQSKTGDGTSKERCFTLLMTKLFNPQSFWEITHAATSARFHQNQIFPSFNLLAQLFRLKILEGILF